MKEPSHTSRPIAPARAARRGAAGLAARIGLLLLVAGACGLAANLLSPSGIPWVQDWGHYIEARAYEARIPLASPGTARSIAAAGTHIIFDARPAADYAAGHLPNALPLPYDETETRLNDYAALLSPGQPVLTYCSGVECDDALLLAVYLRDQGFTNVVLFAGGWEEWQRQGE